MTPLKDWPWAKSRKHEATFAEIRLHYTYTTSLVGSPRLEDVSRRVLKSDIAISASWPSEQGVRLASRYAKLDRFYRKASRFLVDYQIMQSGSLWGAIRFGVRHPLVFFKTLPGYLNVRRSAGAREEAGASTADELLTEAMAALSDVIGEAQAVSALEQAIDRSLIAPPERRDDDFVRILLCGSTHDVLIPGTREVESVTVEPRLLVHSSGVVQLTLAISCKTKLETDSVVDLAYANVPRIARSEVPEPVFFHAARYTPGRYAAHFDSKRDPSRVREVRFDEEPASMIELCELYVQAFAHAAGAELRGEWSCYPTIFTRPACCGGDESVWRANHKEELISVVARYKRAPSGVRNLDPGADLSVSSEHSLYATLGSATHISWTGRLEPAIRDLYTLIVIEYALVLYWRMALVERAMFSPGVSLRGMTESQTDALRLIGELRQGAVRYGSAREVATHLLASLGVPEMRDNIDRQLGLHRQILATTLAQKNARRSYRLSLVAFVLAMCVAVPGVSNALEVVAQIPPDSSISMPVLNDLYARGGEGVAIAIAWLFSVLVVALLAPSAVRLLRIRVRRSGGRGGIIWRHTGFSYSVRDDN